MTSDNERLTAALADRYRIERELGQGGMATVYLAQDLKHHRKVAIKVLKPELAAVLGADRFVQEITTTAQLQHPHILPLFDSGSADGLLYYVMPYIEGETVRDKLNREKQCGIEESVRIATDVADALDYAHRHGVIHRDIKPENILLHDGRPMVMDFGIALAVSAAAGGRMTETGLSLGTPHYMSPEQATADRDITGRSDIYSLASVLYEMLSGEPPHMGTSAQQIIMKIIAEPVKSVTELRRNVPPNVSAAVAKALEKLPADRFDSARAFSDALTSGHFTYATAGVAVGREARPFGGSAILVGAMMVVLGVAVGAWGLLRGARRTPEPAIPLTLETPSGDPELGRFSVSGDGEQFAFATDSGIVVRHPGSREYSVLTGTAMGESPSFSPDGEWVAFNTMGRVRKVPLAGGASIAVNPDTGLQAGRVRWNDDGSIIYEVGDALAIAGPDGSYRLLSKAKAAESPRMLPDGAGVLYVDGRRGSTLMYYDLAADTAYALIESASEGMYIPTGHIVYAPQSGGLFAIRFDPKRHSTSGNPIPIVPDITPNGPVAPFEITRSGMLVYRSGVEPAYRVLVRDVRGGLDTLPFVPKIISYLRVSPDGRSLAMTLGSTRGTNRYTGLYDLALGKLTRFTQEGGGHAPVWSPDGKRLAFTAEIAGGEAEDIYVQPVDRSVAPVRLFRLPDDQHGSAWPNDTMLVFSSQSNAGLPGAGGGQPSQATAAIANPAAPGSTPRMYLSADWGEFDPTVSPNGKWAAFTSLEGGRPEIYVRAFPEPNSAGVVQISSGGGARARWSGDGSIIYYQTADGTAIRAVHVTMGPKVVPGATTTVMTVPLLGPAWDVDWKTGKIYFTQAVDVGPQRIVVIQHWLDNFRRQLAGRQ